MFIHTYVNVYTYDKHTYTYIRIYTYMYLYTYLRKCIYIHTGQVQGGDVNKHAMENATPVCPLFIRIYVYRFHTYSYHTNVYTQARYGKRHSGVSFMYTYTCIYVCRYRTH